MNNDNHLKMSILEGDGEFSLKVSENDMPRIVREQVNAVSHAERELKKALDAAFAAEKLAKNDCNRKGVGFWGLARKDDIKELQKVAISMGVSQVCTAKAIEANLEFVKVLSEVSKYLFFLCVSNMSQTRAIVRQIKKELERASKDELSDFARKEFLAIVRQLKQQESIYERQNALAGLQEGLKIQVQQDFAKRDDAAQKQAEQIFEHCAQLQKEIVEARSSTLALIGENMNSLNQQFDSARERDLVHDRRLDEGDSRDAEHDRRLDEGDSRDAEHDRRLDEGDARDAEHDQRLDEGVARDLEQDNRLDACEKKILALTAQLKDMKAALKELKRPSGEPSSTTKHAGGGYLALLALILSIVAIIICFIL